MTDQRFTVEQTLEWLERAVQERGEDFNYCETYRRGTFGTISESSASCRYVEGDEENPEPGCIAGMVFHYAGIDLSVLSENEGENAENLAWQLGFDALPASLLLEAQTVQDKGGTWGNALNRVKEYAENNNLTADASS